MNRSSVLGMALLATAAIGGCSLVPSAGPTLNEIKSDAGEGAATRYVLRDIDDSVVALFSHVPARSFSATFGARSGAPRPRIGVGDVISVTIWEPAAGGLFSASGTEKGASAGARSAMIPEQTVGADGSISVPYAGRIPVAGKQPAQVEQIIARHLEGRAIQPAVLVTVVRNLSSSVSVVGEVTSGSRVPLSVKGDRVLDVIAAAGGVRAPVYDSFVKIQRGSQTMTLPLQTLVTRSSENIYLQPDDVITVVRDPQTFTVFGAAERNAVVPFESVSLTLEQALAKAGGLIDQRSDPHGVLIMRYESVEMARRLDPKFVPQPGETRVPVAFRLNLRDMKSYFYARQFQIRNGDMIYVANAPLTEIQKVLMLFTLAGQPVQSVNALKAVQY